MIRIFLIDDHKIMREGLKHILSCLDEMTVVGESSDADNVISRITESNANLVITDISLPGGISGIEITSDIKRKNPGIKVICYTMHTEDNYIIEMVRSGVDGYIIKKDSDDELKTAIIQVYGGKSYFCEEATSVMLKTIKEIGQTEPPDNLSVNEKTVLVLIAEGHNTKEIAFKMGLSTKSIDAIRLKVMKKLNLKSVQEIVKYSINNSLIKL